MRVNVIFNDFQYEILPKRLETFEKYCKIIQWGRQHPTRFIEEFFKLQLTDINKIVSVYSNMYEKIPIELLETPKADFATT